MTAIVLEDRTRDLVGPRRQRSVPGLPDRIQRFAVRALIGTGGMGAVYRAHDPQLAREVAIKVIAEPRSTEGLSMESTLDLRIAKAAAADDLLSEARMMAQLSHPNVLPVYEVGLHEGSVFLVMEHIDGCDLAAWLAQHRRTTTEILDIFLQAARGLAAAHERGIIHRDFKPMNVLVGRDGRARVADFGLSRMSAPTGAMEHAHDGRGTPRYMSPELWCGGAASRRSDVFAFAVALDDALGGERGESVAHRDQRWRAHELSPALRACLEASLAEDPARRPEIGDLVASISHHAPHRRSWVLAAGGALAILVGVMTALLTADSHAGPRCMIDRSFLAATPVKTSADVAGAIAEIRTAIGNELDGLCTAVRAGNLSEAAAQMRASCLERRAIELNATADLIVEMKYDDFEAHGVLEALTTPDQCAELQAAALPPEHAAITALHERYIHSRIYAIPSRSKEHEQELRTVRAMAEQLGERELLASASYSLGYELRFQDQLGEAEAEFERAARVAMEIHSTPLAARALLERAVTATLRGDPKRALAYVETARDLSASGPPFLRAYVMAELGRAAYFRGDYIPAIGQLREALDLLAREKIHNATLENDIRGDLVLSLGAHEGSEKDTLAAAKDYVAWALRVFGEKHACYGLALNALAYSLRVNNDLTGAIVARRHALEVTLASGPANSGRAILVRSDLGADLLALGDIDAAYREYRDAVEATEHNERVRAQRPGLLQQLALAAFDGGRHEEGRMLASRAYEETLATKGMTHPATLDARMTLLDFEMELGDLAASERDIAGLEESARADNDSLRLQRIAGIYRADLENRRGHAPAAEKLAREALLAIGELGGTDDDREVLHRRIAESLLSQKRYADALVEANAALDLEYLLHGRADFVAVDELLVARADAGLGSRKEAHQRAQRARTVLETYRGQPLAKSEANKLLAAL